MRFGRFRPLWLFLLLLAAFVIFIEFMADVGGSTDPIYGPTRPLPVASPTTSSHALPDSHYRLLYS